MDDHWRREARPLVKRTVDGGPLSSDVKQRQSTSGSNASPMAYRRQSVGSSSTKEMGTPVAFDPASPSPGQGKRPQATSQDTTPRTPAKKLKFDQELELHVIFPNETAIKFTADARKIQSVVELLNLVKHHHSDHKQEGDKSPSRDIEWGPDVWLSSACGNKLNTDSLLKAISSAKSRGTLKILLHDGLPSSHMDKNMWDVTPRAHMLGSLPQGYTLETALADQVDNALQAIWHNDDGDRCLVSVTLGKDTITIFDTGQGMDGSQENCIEEWGTVGGSKHRDVHHQAVGGDPPFLKPYLGKYGAGAVAAALHLGSSVTVASTTKQAKNVVTLDLDPRVLVGKQKQEGVRKWHTPGKFREITKEEKKMSPHGSFTRVEISKLKSQYCIADDGQYWRVDRIRQLLKDIYFPYIQFDTASSSRTVCSVEFEVNGENLTEVVDCETAVCNLHGCTDDRFVFDIRMTRVLDEPDREEGRTTGSKSQTEEANARVTCQYYPNQKGKESLETVLEEVKKFKPRSAVTFETMNRISIRWLGRLLPEVKWPIFPFMELSTKKEQKSDVRRPWAKRVLAFVDTDAGFHPNQSKTELERDQPFAKALQITGVSDFAGTSAEGVKVSFKINKKELTLPQLTDSYMEWVKAMHQKFDEEFTFLDAPLYIFGAQNAQKEELGVDKENQVLLFHKHMKDARGEYKVEQNNPLQIKLPRGGASRFKSDLFATVEYFFHDGSEDDHGEVKVICRPLEVVEADGCKMIRRGLENPQFLLNKSVWFPASLLGTVKPLDAVTWRKKMEELSNKSPGKLEILNEEDTKKLETGQTFPGDNRKFPAGYTLPTEFLLVVRPKKGSGPSHKQGMIFPESLHILLSVKHCTCLSPCWRGKSASYSGKASSPSPTVRDEHWREVAKFNAQIVTCKSGVKGLYMFSVASSEVSRLVTQGIYTFHFSVEDEKYKDLQHVVSIQIVPSRTTSKWTLCSHKEDCTLLDHPNLQQPAPTIRLNHPLQEDLFVQKYDEYGNRQVFERPIDLEVKVLTLKGRSLEMLSKTQANFVKFTPGGRNRLQIKNLLFTNGILEPVEPTYEGVLRANFQKDQYAEINCRVLPGSLASIQVKQSRPAIPKGYARFQEELQPGEIVKSLTLQGLDACGNKIEKGQKVFVNLEGLEFQDNNGIAREFDNDGCLELGGLLKVTCHYNSSGSINLASASGRKLYAISFGTVRRHLIATQVPTRSYVGRQLEGICVKIVDESGAVDTSVDGYIHSITLDWMNRVTCPFTKGECTLPDFKLPKKPGLWEGKVFFSANTTLSATISVHLDLATACRLGPARRKAEILTAKCGEPLVVPFSVYDDQDQPALLTESMKKGILAKGEAKDHGDESHPIFKRCLVDCKDLKLSRTNDIPSYEAHIVISGSVGTYVITLVDTSFDLKGQVESTCNLEHGQIASLVAAQSDGTLSKPLAVLEAKRCSTLPGLTVTLLDSESNTCSSCEGRVLRMSVLDCAQWNVQTTVVRRGVAHFGACPLVIPVGSYQVSIDLDSSVEDIYSLEEEAPPIRAQFLLKVSPGNYPSALRVLDSGIVSVSLTGESTQLLPRMTVLVDSADGMRLQSRPTVGVKLHGANSDDPKEYFGTLVETPATQFEQLETPEDDLSSREAIGGPVGPVTYEFNQLCVPYLTGTYVLDFFVRGGGGDLLNQSQHLIVRHGPPAKLEIVQHEQAQEEMNVLQVRLIDKFGNLCEDIYDLELSLQLKLYRNLAGFSRNEPCSVYSRCTAVVQRGKADFGVFELSKGVPGMYTLKVFEDRHSYMVSKFSVIPAEVQLLVSNGNISDTIQQGLAESGRYNQDAALCLDALTKSERMVQHLKATLQNLEGKMKDLEVEINYYDTRKDAVRRTQEAARDEETLEEASRQSLRTPHHVFHDVYGISQRGSNAAMTLLDAQNPGQYLCPHTSPEPEAKDVLGLVVLLGRVESEALNWALSDFMGVGSLLTMVCRTQMGVTALEEYDRKGNIDDSKGLHGFARSRGHEITGGYEVLSLMDVRPYYRDDRRPSVIEDHPQKLLNIDEPKIAATGQVPVGFLGFAVNLIHLTSEQLELRIATKQGREAGLRETLFFHLIRQLQVYDTRQHMLDAKSRLNRFNGGAISLDGGAIHANLRQQLGRRSNRIAVSFSMVPLSEMKLISLVPPARDAFQRKADMEAINNEIKSRQESKATIIESHVSSSKELEHMESCVKTAKAQKTAILEKSAAVKKQMDEFRKAAHKFDARMGCGGVSGDNAGSQDGDTERMRVFIM